MTELPVATWGCHCCPTCGETITVTNNVDSTANHYPDAHYWLETAVAGLAHGIDVGVLGTGIIKSTSGIPSLAVAGTDFPGLATSNTFTGVNTFNNSLGGIAISNGAVTSLYALQLSATASSDYGISVINAGTGSAEVKLQSPSASGTKRPVVRFFTGASPAEKGYIGIASFTPETGSTANDLIIKSTASGRSIAFHTQASNRCMNIASNGTVTTLLGFSAIGGIVADTINGAIFTLSPAITISAVADVTIGAAVSIGGALTTSAAFTAAGVVSLPAGGFSVSTHGVTLRTLAATDCYLPVGGRAISTKKGKQLVTTTATLTPKFTDDLVCVTSLSDNVTIANPVTDGGISSAEDGQEMIFRITVAGTAKTITWSGSKYEDKGATKPTTGVASTTYYVRNIYNLTADKWQTISVTSAL